MRKTLQIILLAVAMLAFSANAQITVFSEDFEAGVIPAGWTLIDSDGDGQNWEIFNQSHATEYDGYSMASFAQNTTPDDWLVTPAITLGSSSTLTFWRLKGGYMTVNDHYGVYVSTTSATDLSSFTLLLEETPPAGIAWEQKTVDLSAYSNTTVYIAFRHYNCANQYAIILDEVTVTSTLSSPTIMATPGSLQFPNVLANTTSVPQLVTVSTQNITSDIAATVNAPFEISIDSFTYSNGVMLTNNDHNLYVRYSPTIAGVDSAVISLVGGGALAEVLLYGSAISCDIPTGLSVTTMTSTSAVLNWTGNANSYNIYYKVATATEWDSVENVPADPAGYLLGNLTPSTAYDWYVVAVCDDGSVVSSVATGTFTTSCSAIMAPYTQNFDVSSLPQCWERYTGLASTVFAGGALTPTSAGWNFYNTNVFGAYHPRLNIYGNTSYWLVTPDIDLSTLANPALTFDMALTAWNSAAAISNPNGQPDDKFMVLVSTDEGATWSAANATVWSNDGNGDFVYNQIPAAGEEITISLADYANETVRIAFYGESTVDGNGDNDLHIDNVMVGNASLCPKPTGLAVSAVTANSVTLDWTESGTAAVWNIEYGPAGYQQGSAAATMVTVTTDPFTVGNLPVGVYDFYVQADCGDEQSLWAGPVSATVGGYNMAISGTDTVTTCSMVLYDNGGANGDYAASCDNTLVIMPESAGSFITLSGSYHTESCCDSLRIFDGAGTSGTLLGVYKGTGTIPMLASSTGPLTLHFKSDYGLQYDGFALNVSCATCPPPGNLTVDSVGPNSAYLSWTGASSSYMVEYKADQDAAWTTVFVADTAVTLVGLTESTSYTVKVYGDCGDTYSPATTVTFVTMMTAMSIPFSTDFSDASGWVMNNGACVNYWTIAQTGTTGNALFVTNNGTTPGYAAGTFSSVSAEKLFVVGDAGELELEFDVRAGGEGEFDYLKVFFAPADAEYPASNTNTSYNNVSYNVNAVNFSDYMSYSASTSEPYKFNLTNGNTVHVSVVMPNPNPNPNANSTAKLVFLWKNDSSSGDQPGAVISHVSIAAVTCPSPMNLAVSNVTTTGADVTWSASGSEDDWILEYKGTDDTVWTAVPVSGTPATSLVGLMPGTTYDVRVQTVCGADDHSLWVSTSFTAPCDAVTAFPYTEGFENDGQMPDCWTQEQVMGMLDWTFQGGAHSSSGILNAHGGSYNAYLFQAASVGSTTLLVTPIFNLSGMTDPYVTYWHAQKAWGQDQDVLSVYYRISPDAPWLPLTQHTTSLGAWMKDSLALPNPSATYQLAFQGQTNYGYGIVLDDITVNGTAGAPVVTDPTVTTLAASDIAQTTATLNAQITNPDNVTITERGFELTEVATGVSSTFTAPGSGNAFSADVTNLTAETEYAFRAYITFDGNTVFGNTLTFATESSDTTGIADRLAASVTLYPNPAKEVVNVQCTMYNGQWTMDNGQKAGELHLFDVYGKLLQIVPITSETTQINVLGLADGMYFVRVSTEAGMVTKTFVKR